MKLAQAIGSHGPRLSGVADIITLAIVSIVLSTASAIIDIAAVSFSSIALAQIGFYFAVGGLVVSLLSVGYLAVWLASGETAGTSVKVLAGIGLGLSAATTATSYHDMVQSGWPC